MGFRHVVFLGTSQVDPDRKSTRLNSSHTEIYTLSLHDALPIFFGWGFHVNLVLILLILVLPNGLQTRRFPRYLTSRSRSEEHTSELQSHRDLHSFPTRRSSDLLWLGVPR